MPSLRWGIMGTGWIADKFTRSVTTHTGQVISAIGSRDPEKAKSFSATHGITKAYGSYDALVSDPEIDVIYVATPHNAHHQHVLLALNAGKHVLVEKPIAIDRVQAVEMVELSRRKGLFFAEALWTYYLPKFDVIAQLLESDVLGEIRSVYTEYGENFSTDHRIFDPSLAGGPLLDLGTYPVSLLTKLMGDFVRVTGSGQWDRSGVMGQLAVVLANGEGNIGTMATGLYGFTPTNAIITGSRASIWFDDEFHLPGGFTLRSRDGSQVLHHEEERATHLDGLFHEAVEVARCIGLGLTETPCRNHEDALATMTTLDRIRDALDLRWRQ
ncbi:Gfo/Idh/MocA family oxidoreductase [uncultured Devosia sp.]|uniref:Gfo/Idh/MocA family protein n=1 Tax=uncultured Devosia sp. TaxID=211434 RepID=UPI00260B8C5C|nr:Gfo/Idh/MocA family oxidoreductase [uncultured Devosia sp.]